MLDGLAYTVKKHMPDCSSLITELDGLAVSLLSGEPMASTVNLLSLEEKISKYFSDFGGMDLFSGIMGNV